MQQKKTSTGVIFDQDVLQYLQTLAVGLQRSRSFLVNAIIREHAQKQSEQPAPRESAVTPSRVIKL